MNPLIAHGAHLAGLVLVLLVLLVWRIRDRQDPQALPVIAVAMAGVMAIALFTVSDPAVRFDDFREAYLEAGIAVREAPSALAPMIEKGIFGFVNLPIVAYLFWPFASMSFAQAAGTFSLIGLFCALGAWYTLVRGLQLDRRSALALFFLFAASGPLIYSVKEGNISHFLLWPLAVSMLLLRRGDDFRAGLVLGLVALLKLPFLLFGVYYVLRGRWRVAMGGLLVCATAALASLAVFGWDMHVRWYEYCIQPYGRDPMPAINVQSIQAFVLRLQLGAQGLFRWEVVALSGGWKALSGVLVALLYGGVLLLLWRTREASALPPSRPPASDTEFMLIMALASVTSPLSWSHYFCWFLLPAAHFLKVRQASGPGDRVASGWGWAGLLASSIPVITIRWADPALAELHARSAVSLLLFGGLAWMVWLGCNRRPPA